MALSVTLTVAHNVSTDAAGLDILTKRSISIADNTACLYEADGFRTVLPTQNVQLNLNGVVSTKFVKLYADAAFNVRFGAADADPVAVAPITAGQAAIYVATQVAASIWIENPSSTTAININWAVAGT